MGILPDWMIHRDVKIEPHAEGIKREGRISFGTTSYGYDARIGYKFKIFSPINAREIDPKNFDPAMCVDVDLTPQHLWKASGFDPYWHCMHCGFLSSDPINDKTVDLECKRLKNYILIPPHSFALGETVEEFDIPRDCLAIVLGKSTYARCGLIVNVTPLEPEWKGKVTVELSNTTPLPLRVYAGEGIMQVLFLKAEEICKTSYADKKGKYQNQEGLVLPKVDQEGDKK